MFRVEKSKIFPFILTIFTLFKYTRNSTRNKITPEPSRGGLEVEAWTDNSLHSASVGSNPV